MTNEEIVLKIKAGETELMTDLWLQIERFIRRQAYKFTSVDKWSSACQSAGITAEDLYTAGYFALEPAIKAFDEEKGFLFLTYFSWHLKSVFYKELGVRNKAGKWHINEDGLYNASSLEAPIYQGTDGDEITLAEATPDTSAQQAFDNIEDELYNQRLCADLEDALHSLRPRDAQIIRDHYYNLLSPAEQAEKLGLSQTRIKDLRLRALDILKKHKALQDYRERFLDSTAGTGFRAWKETGMSQQERIVIKLDEYERILGLK